MRILKELAQDAKIAHSSHLTEVCKELDRQKLILVGLLATTGNYFLDDPSVAKTAKRRSLEIGLSRLLLLRKSVHANAVSVVQWQLLVHKAVFMEAKWKT